MCTFAFPCLGVWEWLVSLISFFFDDFDRDMRVLRCIFFFLMFDACGCVVVTLSSSPFSLTLC